MVASVVRPRVPQSRAAVDALNFGGARVSLGGEGEHWRGEQQRWCAQQRLVDDSPVGHDCESAWARSRERSDDA
jgi:hypothetical protein